MSRLEKIRLDAFLKAVEIARQASAGRPDFTTIKSAIVLYEVAPECAERDEGKKALVALYA